MLISPIWLCECVLDDPAVPDRLVQLLCANKKNALDIVLHSRNLKEEPYHPYLHSKFKAGWTTGDPVSLSL